jgi:hypothetical protein
MDVISDIHRSPLFPFQPIALAKEARIAPTNVYADGGKRLLTSTWLLSFMQYGRPSLKNQVSSGEML